jgi:hypothetical protein
VRSLVGGQKIEVWQNWDMLGSMEQMQGAAREGTYIAVA